MSRHHRRIWFLILVVFLAVLVAGAWYTRAGDDPERDWRTAFQVMALVKMEYVDPVSITNLFTAYVHKGTINGMLSILNDPYTRYMDPKAYQDMQIDTSGEFGGIGIYVGIDKENRIQVVAPMKGTPAERAGVKAGDIIVEINGRATKDMSVDEAVAMMRGRKGTEVRIVIERGASRERHTFVIMREIIKVPSVEAKMLDKNRRLGYVQLYEFTEKSPRDMEEALRQLEKEGMRGLILDLRGNPGGLMISAVEIARMFIKEGPILHAVGKSSNDRESYYANGTATHTSYPMVVLVNRASASAAEILAGALQDNKRAIVVGTRTFGKGLVQRIIPLRDGSALSLTTQKWYTAGGRSIAATGIIPDVVVRTPGEEEMERELARMQEKQGQKEEKPKETKPENPEKKLQAQTAKDLQLEKAVEILEKKLAEREKLPLAG